MVSLLGAFSSRNIVESYECLLGFSLFRNFFLQHCFPKQLGLFFLSNFVKNVSDEFLMSFLKPDFVEFLMNF